MGRSDAGVLIRPSFRSALVAAGVALYHLPIYFKWRFCLVQIPASADRKSVDGGLACLLPYLDVHLVDIVPGDFSRWNYIHKTDLQYFKTYPTAGVLVWTGCGFDDRRIRRPFGAFASVWVPRPETSEAYLTTTYGPD